MRERIARFMAGRNGNDQLNMFLLAADMLLLLLGAIFARSIGRVLSPLALALLIAVYLRMFSRNLYKRRQENERYLLKKEKLVRSFRVWRERWNQRRDYKFFTCPSCKAVMRVPKGRGKIRIVCRKCGNSFTGKS